MKCPSCNEMISSDSNICTKCGLVSPGVEYYINSDSFAKWINQVNRLKTISVKATKEVQSNSSRKNDASAKKTDKSRVYTLTKSVLKPNAVNPRYSLGTQYNPVILRCTYNQLYSEVRWNNVHIDDRLVVNVCLPAYIGSFGALFCTLIGKDQYYFVLEEKSRSNAATQTQKNSQRVSSFSQPGVQNSAKFDKPQATNTNNTTTSTPPPTPQKTTSTTNTVPYVPQNTESPYAKDLAQSKSCFWWGVASVFFALFFLGGLLALYGLSLASQCKRDGIDNNYVKWGRRLCWFAIILLILMIIGMTNE